MVDIFRLFFLVDRFLTQRRPQLLCRRAWAVRLCPGARTSFGLGLVHEFLQAFECVVSGLHSAKKERAAPEKKNDAPIEPPSRREIQSEANSGQVTDWAGPDCQECCLCHQSPFSSVLCCLQGCQPPTLTSAGTNTTDTLRQHRTT